MELGLPGITPFGLDPEYIYNDQFDEFYYRSESINHEFTLGFTSYASSLNPESIWISYIGLDMWQD